jgi:hypothetical protein
MTSAAILGSGSFGTALAFLLPPKLDAITLIRRDPNTANQINREHRSNDHRPTTEPPSDKACHPGKHSQRPPHRPTRQCRHRHVEERTHDIGIDVLKNLLVHRE